MVEYCTTWEHSTYSVSQFYKVFQECEINYCCHCSYHLYFLLAGIIYCYLCWDHLFFVLAGIIYLVYDLTLSIFYLTWNHFSSIYPGIIYPLTFLVSSIFYNSYKNLSFIFYLSWNHLPFFNLWAWGVIKGIFKPLIKHTATYCHDKIVARKLGDDSIVTSFKIKVYYFLQFKFFLHYHLLPLWRRAVCGCFGLDMLLPGVCVDKFREKTTTWIYNIKISKKINMSRGSNAIWVQTHFNTPLVSRKV